MDEEKSRLLNSDLYLILPDDAKVCLKDNDEILLDHGICRFSKIKLQSEFITIIVDDDQWIYIPKTERRIREAIEEKQPNLTKCGYSLIWSSGIYQGTLLKMSKLDQILSPSLDLSFKVVDLISTGTINLNFKIRIPAQQ